MRALLGTATERTGIGRRVGLHIQGGPLTREVTATHRWILAEERSAVHAILRRFADVHTTEGAFYIEFQRVRLDDKEFLKRFCGKTDEFGVLGVVRKFWNVRRA